MIRTTVTMLGLLILTMCGTAPAQAVENECSGLDHLTGTDWVSAYKSYDAGAVYGIGYTFMALDLIRQSDKLIDRDAEVHKTYVLLRKCVDMEPHV